MFVKIVNEKVKIVTLLLLFIACIQATTKSSYTCGQDPVRLDGYTGILSISDDVINCVFKTKDDVTFFAIRTQDLVLGVDDSVEFILEADDLKHTYRPPTSPGYLITGWKEPLIKFTFKNASHSAMEVEFFQNKTDLPINGDANNNFKIIPVSDVKDFKLDFTKSLPDPIHIEMNDMDMLISKPNDIIPLPLKKGEAVMIATSPALTNCSNIMLDKEEDSHQLIGPKNMKQQYKCVNIFETTIAGEPHYEANFTGLADPDDQLVIKAGSSRTVLSKSQAGDLDNQILTFGGKKLVVIYYGLGPKNESSPKQFDLKVQAKANGGIISSPGLLNFPASVNQIRYVLRPPLGQYAAVSTTAHTTTFKDVNITIFSEGKIIARFRNFTQLPPVIALEKPNTDMILEFSAATLTSLSRCIEFKPLSSHCHRLTSGTIGGFSVIGREGPCYWTLASNSSTKLNIDYNDLIPSGCITIKSLYRSGQIYNQCHINSNTILPTFVLTQAWVEVNLPSVGTRVDASLSSSPHSTQNQIEPAKQTTVSSLGYPSSYVWSTNKQFYTSKADNKIYLLSVVDVDIRVGEKLYVADAQVTNENKTLGDIVAKNLNITIIRPSSQLDFTNHRGFNLKVTQFDQIIEADIRQNSTTTPQNGTRILFKISTRTSDLSKISKTISYKIVTDSDDKKFQISVHDGRSILARSIDQHNGNTTSDTMFISYTTDDESVKQLPKMVVSYWTQDCAQAAGHHICDNFTRCVAPDKLCKGIAYCEDGSDLKQPCSSGPAPEPAPKIVETGISGASAFFLCVLMLTLGAVSALYGPDLYRTLQNRFRPGQYTTFTSNE